MKLGRYIVGLVSGLTFGMLFAPKKGKKLRQDLSRKGNSAGGQEALVTLFEAFKDAGVDAASEMRKLTESEQIQSALSMSKDKMRDYLSQLEEGGYDVAATAQEKVDEFSDMAEAAAKQFKKRAVRQRKAVVSKVKQAKRTVKKAQKTVKKASSKVKSVAKVAKKPSPKKSPSRKSATRRKSSAPKKK